MSSAPPIAASPRVTASAGRQLLQDVLAPAGIQLDGPGPWDVRIRDERAVGQWLRGSMGVGESYVEGWWDAERVDELVCRVLRHRIDARVRRSWPLLWSHLRARLLNLQTVRRAPQVARVHYDLGNDFFERVLGPTMAYSCGYWREAQTLDEAQRAKLELVCRKLQLREGERLLDVGCGWGGLLAHAARHHGCSAVGITISRPQYEYARALCEGLPVQVLLCDYRDPGLRALGPFDKIASVGMFEHVGRSNYRTFMRVSRQLLEDDGLLLLHTIGNVAPRPPEPWTERYIFPNGMLPSPGDVGRALEGLFVLEDWHNFGADYDRTLMAWHANFERAVLEGRVPQGERFERMWRFYLLSFAGTFRARNRMQLWQLVLSPSGVPGGYQAVR